MKVKYFERKAGIKITSGIMPIRYRFGLHNNPWEYAFRYTNKNNTVGIFLMKIVELLDSNTYISVEEASTIYERDINRSFLKFNDPLFETYLEWYWTSYGAKRFNLL